MDDTGYFLAESSFDVEKFDEILPNAVIRPKLQKASENNGEKISNSDTDNNIIEMNPLSIPSRDTISDNLILIENDRNHRRSVNKFIIDKYSIPMSSPAITTELQLNHIASPTFTTEQRPLKNVLIVDDSKVALKMISHILTLLGGFCCYTAENGEEAKQMFVSKGEFFFDVILMDVFMPVMDGLTSISHICDMVRLKLKPVP